MILLGSFMCMWLTPSVDEWAHSAGYLCEYKSGYWNELFEWYSLHRSLIKDSEENYLNNFVIWDLRIFWASVYIVIYADIW